MYDFMLSDEERSWRDRAREFAKEQVEPEYLQAMDREEVRFPRELYESYARHGLLGLPAPVAGGGSSGLSRRARAGDGCL